MKIVGHRGASAICRENTVAAFLRAFDDGADGVELDVRLCRSGELVVLHDARLDRVWGGGGPLWHLDLSEVRRLAPGLPTLDEAWDSIAGRGFVNVEAKAGPILWKERRRVVPAAPWRPTAWAVSRWVRRRRLQRSAADRFLLSSFDPRILGALALLVPRVGRALIVDAAQRYPLSPLGLARALACTAIHLEQPIVDRAIVGRAHAKGISVTGWLVGTAEEAARMRDAGVDVVVTNDPGRLRAEIEGKQC